MSSPFLLEAVQLQFGLLDLISVRSSNNILVLAVRSGTIYRIDLTTPEKVDRTDLKEGTIKQLFLDPTGHHLLITTVRNNTYYLHRSARNALPLARLRMPITYVHWPQGGVSENGAKNFLIGTGSGHVYELLLEYKLGKIANTFLKSVWKSPLGSQAPIDGIFTRLVENKESKNFDLYTIFIQAEDIFYYKTALFEPHFRRNHSLFALLFGTNYTDYERLDDAGAVSGSKFGDDGSDFCWLTASGVIFTAVGRADTSRLLTQLNYILNVQLPPEKSQGNNRSVLLTPYHVVYLRNSELIAINKISQEIVYHRDLPMIMPDERFLGVVSDIKAGTYWLYSNYNIYEILVHNEAKGIWKTYLQNGEYDNALEAVESEEGNTQFSKDLILSKKADYLLANKDYDGAAVTYALTARPFETVSLALLEANQKKSLLRYLETKLDLLGSSTSEDDEFYIQKTILGSWAVELYVGENKENKHANEPLCSFIARHKAILDRKTVYQILQSHLAHKTLLFYAQLIEDHDFILSYWINLKQWDAALTVLERYNVPELVYKFSDILLLNAPEHTLRLWRKLYRSLDYRRLVPALLTCSRENSEQRNSIADYLRFLIFEADALDAVVHNTYLAVLVSVGPEEPILAYLEKYGEEPRFEVDFILRLLLRNKKYRLAVHVYSQMKEYESAVALCLRYGYMDLACLVAERAHEGRPGLRKKLWMKIAERMIQQLVLRKIKNTDEVDYEKAIQKPESKEAISKLVDEDDEDIQNLLVYLLGKCELLSIKDLLPLFPSFQSINNFKQEIIKNLEAYGMKIGQLNALISNSIKFNADLSESLKELKLSRYFIIEVENLVSGGVKRNNSSCELCGESVFIKKFAIFPCQHCFHIDCLANFILNSSNKRNYRLKKTLLSQLEQSKVKTGIKGVPESGSKVRIGNVKIPKDLEQTLCAKCVLCSEINIDSIDEPFVNELNPEDSKLAEDWAL